MNKILFSVSAVLVMALSCEGGGLVGGTLSPPAPTATTNGGTYYSSTLWNSQFYGITTNFDLQNYPSPGDVFANVDSVPNVYFFTGFGTNFLTEAIFKADIDTIATNGYPQMGINYFQIDAGWASRVGGGIVFDPNDFTSTGAQLIKYAHDRGVRVGAYVNITTNTLFDQISSGGQYMEVDVSNLLNTIGFDGLKIDGTIPGSNNEHVFWSMVTKWNKGTYRQMSTGVTPAYPGALFEMNPLYPKYVNSVYSTIALPDSYAPFTFSNAYTHFTHTIDVTQMGALSYVKPGFYLEGIGWVYSGTGSEYYPYPAHVYYDLSAMTCSRVLIAPSTGFVVNAVLNPDFLAILRDPWVKPCNIILTNLVNSSTNYTLVRTLGAVDDLKRALCFVNAASVTNTMSVNLTNLSYGTNSVFTLYNPWFHCIEGWGTNSFSVAVPPTNSLLYVVRPGFQTPTFTTGTNYLSDQPFNSHFLFAGMEFDYGENGHNWKAAIGRDARDGNPATPLLINSVTYPKGFCASLGTIGGLYNPVSTNTTFTITVGGVATNLSFVAGKQDAWDGGTLGLRFTVKGDGVQLFQSGWVTNNSSQSTNVSLNIRGVNKLTFLEESTSLSSTVQGVWGNCAILVPPVTNAFAYATIDNSVTWTPVPVQTLRSASMTYNATSFSPAPFYYTPNMSGANNTTLAWAFDVPLSTKTNVVTQLNIQTTTTNRLNLNYTRYIWDITGRTSLGPNLIRQILTTNGQTTILVTNVFPDTTSRRVLEFSFDSATNAADASSLYLTAPQIMLQ